MCIMTTGPSMTRLRDPVMLRLPPRVAAFAVTVHQSIFCVSPIQGGITSRTVPAATPTK